MEMLKLNDTTIRTSRLKIVKVPMKYQMKLNLDS